MNRLRVFLALVALLAALPQVVFGQPIDVLGARAAGMAGAFTGVADDASAAYWNPGGLAAGAYFSLVLDGGSERAAPDGSLRGRRESAFFLGATIPAVGLTYYRLRASAAVPYAPLVPIDEAVSSRNLTGPAPVRLDTLVTHHAGVTLVQSVLSSVAVGATLKLVRGIAASDALGFVTADEALDTDVSATRGSTAFDVDVGVMATTGSLKAGLTVRNVRAPEFTVPDGSRALRLERQARAGASYALTPNWLIAADVDLLETDDPLGERRDVAAGLEGRLVRRVTIRSGVRVNAAGNDEDDADSARARVFAVGGSFAVTASVLIDGAAVLGNDRAGRGWRVGARFVY